MVTATLGYSLSPEEEWTCRGVDLASGLAPSRVPFSLWEEGHSDTRLSLGDSMQTERC